MHTLQGSMGLAPTYTHIWGTPQPERGSKSERIVAYLAASIPLSDCLEQVLHYPFIAIKRITELGTLTQRDPGSIACAVVDLDLFSLESEALRQLIASEQKLPLVFIGTSSDLRLPVRALKAGAVDFFPKPLDVEALKAAVVSALEHDHHLAAKRLEYRELRSRHALLTPREREVLPLVVGGLLNKQAAALLGISEITLQIHRGQVMRKMQAASLPDLVRMCMKLRVRHWRPTA